MLFRSNPTTHQKLKHSLIAILIIMTSSTVTSLGKEIANQPDTPVQQAAQKKTTNAIGAHGHTAATSAASSSATSGSSSTNQPASSSTPDPVVPSPTENTNPASSTTPPPVCR